MGSCLSQSLSARSEMQTVSSRIWIWFVGIIFDVDKDYANHISTSLLSLAVYIQQTCVPAHTHKHKHTQTHTHQHTNTHKHTHVYVCTSGFGVGCCLQWMSYECLQSQKYTNVSILTFMQVGQIENAKWFSQRIYI